MSDISGALLFRLAYETRRRQRAKQAITIPETPPRLEAAYRAIWRTLNQTFPRLARNLRFEHYDVGGYWFSFDLVNDSRRQTWCVRPSDL